MSIAAKTRKVYKHIKQPMNVPAKTQKYQKTMSTATNTRKVYKHIKKIMSVSAKTQKYQKHHGHSRGNEKSVQTHQKNNEHNTKSENKSKNQWAQHRKSSKSKTKKHSNKNEKTTALPEPPPPPPQNILPFWAPALGNIAPPHAHTASPRPLARTHDTNTKRNRNRFPDWGSTASTISPQSPIHFIGFQNSVRIRLLDWRTDHAQKPTSCSWGVAWWQMGQLHQSRTQQMGLKSPDK